MQDSTCTVSSAILQSAQQQTGSVPADGGGCTASADLSADSSAVLQISFPCTRQPFAAVPQAAGPALNIWVDIQGMLAWFQASVIITDQSLVGQLFESI